MSPTRINPKSIQNEANYLPDSIEDAARLREALVSAGQPPAAANGIVAWLTIKATGGHDDSAQSTRSRYRRILAENADLIEWARPDEPRTPRIHVTVKLLVAA